MVVLLALPCMLIGKHFSAALPGQVGHDRCPLRSLIGRTGVPGALSPLADPYGDYG